MEPVTADRLFAAHFAPLYPKEVLATLETARDSDANPANNPALVAKLGEIADAFATLAPHALGDADLALDFSDASIHRLAPLLTKEQRDAWADDGGRPTLLANFVIHGALYLGACIVKNHGGTWLVRSPAWESKVRLESAAGVAEIAPFAWWLKALSDAEIGQGRLGDRYRAHVEVPTFDARALPVIAPPDRKLPRLAKVTYHALFQHLRAHLPELRELGEHFPSAERLAELALKSIDFALVGGGRLLLMSGANADGLHLYWLDRSGFVKAAFYPADGFPAPVVQSIEDGEKIRISLAIGKQERTFELLFWGP